MSHCARADVQAFFERYEAAANSGDVAVLDRSFTDVFLSLDPSSASAVTAQAMIAALPARRQMFAGAGVLGTQLQSIAEQPLDDHHTLVRTEWALRLTQAPDGHAPTLHSTFLLHREPEGWRIAVYLNHQDVAAVLATLARRAAPAPGDGRG